MNILRETINFYFERKKQKKEKRELVTANTDRNVFEKMINSVSLAGGRRVEVVIKQVNGQQIIIRQEPIKELLQKDPFLVEIEGYGG